MVGKSLVTVGRYTYGIEHVTVRQWGEGASLKIGSFCSIAASIMVFLGGNHKMDWSTTYPFGHINQETFGDHSANKKYSPTYPFTNGDVVIGHDVWVGDRVTIMSGVTIGTGAVIAANSHVIKDVAPYEIVGGNPAKHIKYRFGKDIQDLLLELKWWELSVESLREVAPELCQLPTVELLKNLIERYKVRSNESQPIKVHFTPADPAKK